MVRTKRLFTKKELNEINKLFKQGKTLYKISKILNRHYKSVYRKFKVINKCQ